jgi:hypothetical protein
VHPSRCKAVASARLKNDKAGAAILGQLLRADLLPEAWIAPPAIGRLRALLRHRIHAVLAGFAAASALLREELAAAGRPADSFPRALVTMWAWITEDRAEADRIITGRLAPLLRRDPAALRGRVCVGPAGMCAELLSGVAETGCDRVHFWPLGAEGRQVDLIASRVLPGVAP